MGEVVRIGNLTSGVDCEHIEQVVREFAPYEYCECSRCGLRSVRRICDDRTLIHGHRPIDWRWLHGDDWSYRVKGDESSESEA